MRFEPSHPEACKCTGTNITPLKIMSLLYIKEILKNIYLCCRDIKSWPSDWDPAVSYRHVGRNYVDVIDNHRDGIGETSCREIMKRILKEICDKTFKEICDKIMFGGIMSYDLERFCSLPAQWHGSINAQFLFVNLTFRKTSPHFHQLGRNSGEKTGQN